MTYRIRITDEHGNAAITRLARMSYREAQEGAIEIMEHDKTLDHYTITPEA